MKTVTSISSLTKFSPATTSKILKRDKHQCLFCKLKHHIENYNENKAEWLFHDVEHYIPKSKNGLGIEQNGFEICLHHQRYYNDPRFHAEMLGIVENYLKSIYKDWKKENLVYKEDKVNE